MCKVVDWRVNDTMKWLNEIGLSVLARKAYATSLTGRQLLASSEDELTNRLLIDQDDDVRGTRVICTQSILLSSFIFLIV